MKRITFLLLAICLLFAAFGCGGDPGNNNDNTTVRTTLNAVEVKILLGAAEAPADYVAVVSEINKRLALAGKPYTVKFDFGVINTYATNIESKANAGYDGAWAHVSLMPSLIQKKVIKTNLKPYLDVWGTKILQNAKSYTFDNVTNYSTGNIYAVPALVPTANGHEIMALRKDFMDKVSMSEVTTLAQFDTYLSKITSDTTINNSASFYALTPDYFNAFLTREYCPSFFFPIEVDGRRPVYIDINAEGKPTVKSFYQTDEFIDMISKARSYQAAGYINTSQNINGESQFYSSLTGAISDYAVLKMSERINVFKASNPNGQMYDFLIQSPTNKKIVFNTVGDSMVALSKGKNTEEFIDFLNWTKMSQANHDLICYGVLGKNYYLTESGRITFTNPVNSSDVITSNMRFTNNMPYWAMQDISLLRWSESLPQDYIDNVLNWEGVESDGITPNYILSPFTGFVVQETNALVAARTAVFNVDSVVNNLMRGTEAHDRVTTGTNTVYSDLIAAITYGSATNNPIYNLIAEVQRQLDEFLTYKNK